MKKKKRKTFLVIICIVALIQTYFTFLYVYDGKVIDAETREPIVGAVIVATWHQERATITGGSQRLKDVKETLTDKNGEWNIRGSRGNGIGKFFALFPGMNLLGINYTKTPEFIAFKPGYCSYRKGFRVDACKEKMKPFGIGHGEITELPKLTKREDRLRVLPSPKHKDGDQDVYRKQKEFLKLIDEERKYLGIPEHQLLGVI